MNGDPAIVTELALWKSCNSYETSDCEFGATTTELIELDSWKVCPDSIQAAFPNIIQLHQEDIGKLLIDNLQMHGVEVQRPWTFVDSESVSPERLPIYKSV